MLVDLSQIPDGWWLYGLFHNHTPQVFAGDVHRPCSLDKHGVEEWTCKLQSISGGSLVQAGGDNADHAVRMAALEVAAGLAAERWGTRANKTMEAPDEDERS